MKIIDEQGNEITNPDLEKGHLVDDSETVHHDAVERIPAVAEQIHYELVHEYPNGGKDMKTVIDVQGSPAVDGKPAYDEEVAIQKYILYTTDELKAIEDAKNRPSDSDRITALENTVCSVLGLF